MPDSEVLLVASRFQVVREFQLTSEGVRPREIVRHPGAVVVLPLLDDGRVCLICNYRISVKQTLIELPAGTIDPGEVVPDDKPFLAEAQRIAATIDWADDPWQALTDALKAATTRKGRALFHPLRRALTGRDSGPEMGPLLRLIGQQRTLERLARAAS